MPVAGETAAHGAAFARMRGRTAAGRRFGVSARTIRRWRVRWRGGGLEGLVPRFRVDEGAGSPRESSSRSGSRPRARVWRLPHQLWLHRVHEVRVAIGTIQRIFRDLGLPRLRRTRKRLPRQMKLLEKAEPGESVQVDVKFVKIAGRWAFQYTSLDDCTRFPVLRLYRRLSPRLQPGVPRRAPAGVALPDPQAAVHSTIAGSSCWTSPWPSRRLASSVATSGRGIPSGTARSNAVTESTKKRSGDAVG